MMQIRFFFLFASLTAASLLKATEHPSFETDKKNSSNVEWACNYPAPTNFQIDGWGYQPDWVHLKWDLTNPDRQHRIKVYSCKDSSLIRSVVVSAGVTDTTLFFYNPPLNAFYFEIKAMCTSGDSPNSAWIACFGGTGVGVIHDLIVAGITPPASMGPEDCRLRNGVNERCYFSNTGTTTFRVQRINNIQNKKSFNIRRIIDPNWSFPHYELDALVQNGPPSEESYQFFSNDRPPTCYDGTQYEIKQNGRIVAVFAAGEDHWTGESYLMKRSLDDYYEVVRVSPYTPGGKPGGERDDQDETIASSPASASPNPFSETLDVFPGNPGAENIHLQLYNLSGQNVLNQQFTGGQEQYSLSTTGLSPGFYLLRIEADGEVQTLKVVKSE